MTGESVVYLRQNIQVEPLIDRWYAWTHLIPPATAARNLTERHLKIMDSYIRGPQLHAAAVKNPKMLGGPFVDYDGGRVDEMRQLRDQIKAERADLVELSKSIEALDQMLRENAKGFGLLPLYPQVPPSLRGQVELVYDLNNNASFRLIEPLLYRSYSRYIDSQSLMLQLIGQDDRPFILSTPRLDSDASLHLRLPFNSACVDDLFRLKKVGSRWSSVEQEFSDSETSSNLLRTFFIEEPARSYAKYDGNGARWRYFGHACILLESGGKSILFDPVLSYTYESSVSRYTYEDLPDHIDYVLITHNHQDHVLLETLLQLRHKIGALLVPRSGVGRLEDPSLKLTLEACGFHNVVEVDEMEEIRDISIAITGLPFFGEHGDLNVQSKRGWHLNLAGHTFLFLSDSCNVEPELYLRLQQELGYVEILFLGMECDGAPLTWIYGPLLTQRLDRAMDESRRLCGSNFKQGVNVVDTFKCQEVYVYAMGQEPWLNHIMSLKYTNESKPIVESEKLIAECRARGIISERLFGEKEVLLNA